MASRIAWIGCCVCFFVSFLGCQGSNSTPEAAAPATTADGDLVPASLSDGSSPDQVVEAFLAALRDGDERSAEGLLTSKAREETIKHDLVVEPPGTPTAEFEVGDTVLLKDDPAGAHVTSVWLENDAQHQGISYEIVWALRKQPEGWRIAGMATEIIAGQAPVFLNFEDPADMLEKWRRAEEIASSYQQQAADQSVPTRR